VLPEIAAGRMAVVVDRVLPLAQAPAAHRLLEASSHFGKIVLSVPPL
jgi:NADPH:quinone reductase